MKSVNRDPIELAVFQSRLSAVCETMGVTLRRAAISPNIRDRLDFSCALFDADGGLLAQATHIPVHLGSMAWAMTGLAGHHAWQAGDRLILNDPYRGGTHLPDVTVIAPVFVGGDHQGFVANRAHHADIGAHVPGSMPLSRRLDEEGLLISPVLLYRAGELDETVLSDILEPLGRSDLARGDFRAQVAACDRGERDFRALVTGWGRKRFAALSRGLNAYAADLGRAGLTGLQPGIFRATDRLDDDGQGLIDLEVRVAVEISDTVFRVDFTGTCGQVEGNMNCPLSVTAAAVYYVYRCLLADETPDCAGSLSAIDLHAPEGCLVNAGYPAAVAAGNVETSQRLVDVLLRALSRAAPERIPAASQGTMNNLALGGDGWSYYETLAGGCGGSPECAGRNAAHSHMTNTLNTPVEVLEWAYPLRVTRYALREYGGGAGRHPGGRGIVREYEFLDAAEVCLIAERRRHAPWGLAGGGDGAPGQQFLDGGPVPGKFTRRVAAGQRLRIETPGGGGYGTSD